MNPHEYLNSFINFESHLHKLSSRSFNLDRIYRLLCSLGNPQSTLKFVHVAGTKGKGSTCVFIASILRAAGYRVGLYTSPHFYRVNERIRLLSPDGKRSRDDFEGSVTDRELIFLIKKIKVQLEKFRNDPVLGKLTYFEVLTAIAFCYFAHKKAQVVVLETGLGGRLDATNVVDAIVNVITPIGFDHMHLLGNTIKQIAGEKAAIIKHSFSRVIVAPQNREAMKVILDRCKNCDIHPVVVGKDIKCFGSELQSFEVHGQVREYKNLKTLLVGRHQRHNASCAIAVIESLRDFGFKVTPKAIAQGILQAKWPGRFEIIHKKPTIVIDSAHNIDSAQALKKTFQAAFPNRKAILILGISTDKDVNSICRALVSIAKDVILTRAHHPRAHVFNVKIMKKIFNGMNVMDAPEVKDALRHGRMLAGASGVILATGSVFLAAEVRQEVKGVSI